MVSFYKTFARAIFGLALLFVTAYLLIEAGKFAFAVAAPILYSLLIYILNKPLIEWLIRKNIKRMIATNIVYLVFIAVFVAVALGMRGTVFSEIREMIKSYPYDMKVFVEKFHHWAGYTQSKYEHLSPNIVDFLQRKLTTIQEKIGTWSSPFFLSVLQTFRSFWSFVGEWMAGVILAYFLSLEVELWRKFFVAKTPNTFKRIYFFLSQKVFTSISTYIKARLLLMLILFVILFVTLLYFHVQNAFTVSLLGALLDIIPVIGLAMLFLPWLLYLFIVGSHVLAYKLIGLWLFAFAIKHILEPKIIGDSLGVSPYIMLSAMIVFYAVWGIIGLILAPLFLILLKALYVEGYFRKWIPIPKEEFERENL